MNKSLLWAFAGGFIAAILYFIVPLGWMPLFPILLLALITQNSVSQVAFTLPETAGISIFITSFIATIIIGGLAGIIIRKIVEKFR